MIKPEPSDLVSNSRGISPPKNRSKNSRKGSCSPKGDGRPLKNGCCFTTWVVLMLTTAGFSFSASFEKVSLVILICFLRSLPSRVFQRGSPHPVVMRESKATVVMMSISPLILVDLELPVFTVLSPFLSFVQNLCRIPTEVPFTL